MTILFLIIIFDKDVSSNSNYIILKEYSSFGLPILFTESVFTNILIALTNSLSYNKCTGLSFPGRAVKGFSPYLGGPPNWAPSFLSVGNPTLSLLPNSPFCRTGAPGLGLLITPIKIGILVTSCISAKKKGWLRWKTGLDALEITTVVAAAASAPSSFISMLDLCITLDTSRGPSEISAKLGEENISPRPNKEHRV